MDQERYEVILLRQALMLLDHSGSESEWLTWAGEVRRRLRVLGGQ